MLKMDKGESRGQVVSLASASLDPTTFVIHQLTDRSHTQPPTSAEQGE